MIVVSNVSSWIMIDDIGVRIPPKGKGEAAVPDEKIAESRELMGLITMGTVSVVMGTDDMIRPMILGDRTVYSVPSTDIWGEAPPLSLDWKMGMNEKVETVERIIKHSKVKPKRKFKIKWTSKFGVCIDSIGASLSKHVPIITLDEEKYYDEGVQLAISRGDVELSEILEERIVDGKSTWESVKNKEEIQRSIIPMSGTTCVHWEGPIFDGGGYANMNRQMIFHMDDAGVCVKPSMVSTLMDVEKEVRERLIALSHNMIPIKSPKVYATNVPNSHPGRSIAYTMMETENVIHPLLAHKLMIADEIWVPCEWNRRVFVNSGVNRDIRVMPLGVDHRTYHPSERSVYFSNGTKGFTFISVFNWNWRKGFDVMLKAYIRAFTDKDDVSLVMVSRFVGQKSLSDRIYSDIKECTRGERQEDRPHLALVDNVIPTFLMPRMYNSGDAFCLFSRGEGWGLPAIEAGASGVPLLTSLHGGHEMFLDDDVANLVRPDIVSRVHKSIEWISPFYSGMEFVDYSDKAVDEIAERMRWMYENRDDSALKADACRRRILSEFTWEKSAERVIERLEEIQP